MAARGGEMRTLDFGSWATVVTHTGTARTGLRLAPEVMSGPGKYRILAERRRRAQIRARHVLGVDAWEEPARGEAGRPASGVRNRVERGEEVR